ncbi:MAG: hypothetical protein Q8N51_04170 [Gammaproteobacteria bacterium]|nr:hypothetical protein [Gammaproteobacteria bacterium]
MKAVGVTVDLRIGDDAIHGFAMFLDRCACARQSVADAAEFLRTI